MKNTLALFALVALALAAACTTSTNENASKGTDGGTVGSQDASTLMKSGVDAGACQPELPEVAVTFLNGNCMPCHNTANRSGSVILDTYAGLLAVPKPDRNGTPSLFASVGDLAVDEVTSGEMPVKFNSSSGTLEPKPLDASVYGPFKAWVNAGMKPAACP